MANCPNCGAPLEPYKNRCEYCGTIFNNTRDKDNSLENSFLKLNLIYQLNQLNMKKRNLEFKMAYDKMMADTKQSLYSLINK